MSKLAAYDITRTYDWNYDHAPIQPPERDVPPYPGTWHFCGLPVNSPLGIPAGPLLNSRWILYYAALGFDVLTYKTVRSSYRASFDLPNLVPVEAAPLAGEGGIVRQVAFREYDSWAISFGMPSKDPAVWREDVTLARRGLAAGQVLVVSVVASPQPGWTLDDLARDFAQCARWAADAGAQVVEPNLSCPNVCTAEADLYLSADASRTIAQAVRAAVPELPLVLKAGLFENTDQMRALVEAVRPYVNGISATNSITAKVESATEPGRLLFGGLRRGIGGAGITARCLEETRRLAGLCRTAGVHLISAGGVHSARDVEDRLQAGAHHVQIATAAMLDPGLALKLRVAAQQAVAR